MRDLERHDPCHCSSKRHLHDLVRRRKRLTRITANPLGSHDVPGSWSPNGKSIVFTRYDASGNSAGAFVVNTKNGQLRQILRASVELSSRVQADWSPQGNEIIVSLHATPDDYGSIWVLHANGTGLTQVTFDGRSDDPAWGTHPLAH